MTPRSKANQDNLPVEAILSDLGAILASFGANPELAKNIHILDPQDITEDD